MHHVMIDIETLGTEPDAAILSIGACKFDPAGDDIVDKFYIAATIESCLQYKMSVGGSTIEWWFHPDRDEARRSLQRGPQADVATALEGFHMWFGPESLPVWGNGACFDNVIVRQAYTRVGIEPPWRFNHDRCYRTLKSLFPDIQADTLDGVHHNALDDAIYQTRHLQKIWRQRADPTRWQGVSL
jgi:hypothetical protein